MSEKTIGFIGLGHMGGPMAANLVAAGYTVQGFDLVPAALEQAKSDGVTVVDSALAAVQDASIVVTMLPNGRLVLDLYADLLPAAAPGTLFVDSSTIDVADAHAAHKMVQAAGHRGLDAPVSGGVGGAAARGQRGAGCAGAAGGEGGAGGEEAAEAVSEEEAEGDGAKNQRGGKKTFEHGASPWSGPHASRHAGPGFSGIQMRTPALWFH